MASFGISFCPHCNKPVDFSIRAGGISKSKIGTPTVCTCKHYGEQFTDGMKEWKEMSAIEKTSEIIRFVTLDIIITLVAGFVVALGVSIPLNLTTNTMCVIFLCAAVAALAVSIFLNVRKIRLSNKRLAEKQE